MFRQGKAKATILALCTGCPDVLAVQKDLAGGGLQQTVELLHQGGLTGAGMSDDADELSPVYRKGHIVQRLDAREGFADVCHLQQNILYFSTRNVKNQGINY